MITKIYLQLVQNPIINVLLITVIVIWIMTILSIWFGYQSNNKYILKLVRANFFYYGIHEQDGAYFESPFRVNQIKYGNIIVHKNRSYVRTESSPFHKRDSRPLYVYYWDHPLPLTLKHVDKTIDIDGQKLKVSDIFINSHKQPLDSKQLFEVIDNKIVNDINKIRLDKFIMLAAMFSAISVIISLVAVMDIFQVNDGMKYINTVIEEIAKQNPSIKLPPFKPSILGG